MMRGYAWFSWLERVATFLPWARAEPVDHPKPRMGSGKWLRLRDASGQGENGERQPFTNDHKCVLPCRLTWNPKTTGL